MKKIMLFLTGILFIALFMGINQAFAIKDTVKVTTSKSGPYTTTSTASITVYSDTTGANDSDSLSALDDNHFQTHQNHRTTSLLNEFTLDDFRQIMNNMTDITGYAFFAIIATVFVLPILLISIVCFFIYRMRREKYRAMQEAYKHGINISQNPRPISPSTCSNNQYLKEIHMEKCIKQASIGLGLMLVEAFFGFGGILGAIGAFIFCLATGRLLIYLLITRKRQDQQATTNNEEEEYIAPNAESTNTTVPEEENKNNKENNPSNEAPVN